MTGTWVLLRVFLRRDRWLLLWWGLGAMLLYWSQAVSVDGLYSSQAEFDRAAAMMQSNAGFIAMAGPPRALNTVGGQVAWQASAFGAVVAGLMSMFIVGRHTRAEEESGRDEMMRAAAVGRFASTTAAFLSSLVANVVLGALVAGSLIAYPLAVSDSLALGVGLTLCGAVFTGIALVAAQLSSSTRGMYGLTGAFIGLSYALRAVGDVGNPVFRWLSPIGWYQSMHAFSGVRWWPALLLVVATLAAGGAAYAVFVRRDYGNGVLAARPGPARAAGRLHRTTGLPWRLQRGSLLGWGIGLFATGMAYGSLGKDVEALIGDSQVSRDMFLQGGGSIVDAFYASSILMLALLASGFAISSALRPRAEEDAGHLEFLLGTALSRRRWLLGHVGVTVVGTALVLLASGLGLGLGYALVTGDAGALLRYVLPSLADLAPVLLLAALARLCFGLAPRLVALAWLPLLWCVVVMMFGELLRIPQWLQGLSPFEHLALLPAQEFRALPWVMVVILAAILSVAGQLAFARRDIR